MKFRLFYEHTELGTIRLLERDFPGLLGNYELLADFRKKEGLINQYIDYSIQASKLMEKEESKWLAFMEEHEPKFSELIESEAWTLVNEEEEILKITIPNFCDNHEVIWR